MQGVVIKLHVSEVLDLHNSNFNTWCTMFKNAFRKFGITDHVNGSVDALTVDDDAWLQIDQYIVSWLYTSVSKEILDLVLEPDDTAASVWHAIVSLFLDNSMQRAVYAKQEFHSLFQGDLSILEYSSRLKTLADTLRDVGYPVSDKELVVNFLRGLGKPFSNAVSNLTLPTAAPVTFRQARSYLLQEERRLLQTAKMEASSAMVAGQSSSASSSSKDSGNSSNGDRSGNGDRGKDKKKANQNGDGRNRYSGNNNNGSQRQSAPPAPPAHPWSGYVHTWQMLFRPPGAGILGPRPSTPQGLAAFPAPAPGPYGAPAPSATPLPAPPPGTA